MTTCFGTNSAGDIYINPSGNLQVNTGQAAVETACQTASLMRLGEGVLQSTLGLPFFQALFNGTPNPAIVENSLRTTLLNIDGVENVTVVELSQIKNTFSYSATIESIYGNTFTITG